MTDTRHNSEQIGGGPRLTRKTSKRALGEVPGFDGGKKVLPKGKALQHFVRLMQKFMML